jgi:aryl-alcohol dehydrogenase-like predicted oxidoreductase
LKIIPRTTLEVSAICLGTADLAQLQDPYAMLDAYLANGGNFIDTAHVYSNWLPGERSSSEKTIGRWLKAHGIPRDSVVIATKGAHPDLATMNIPRMSPAEIEQDLNESLSHLQIDTIDLYWLHRDGVNHPVSTIIDALEAQVKAGKIRYYGCSNWSAARIKEANEYAQAAGHTGFVANQPLWSLAKINPATITDPTITYMDDAMYAYHKETGLTALPFTSQAQGYFSKMAAVGSQGMSPKLLAQYDNPTTQRRFEAAQDIASRTGYSLSQIALAYLMQQPFTTIPIVGCKNRAQLEDSLSAIGVALSTEDFNRLL